MRTNHGITIRYIFNVLKCPIHVQHVIHKMEFVGVVVGEGGVGRAVRLRAYAIDFMRAGEH